MSTTDTDHIVYTQLGDNPITLLGTAHVSRASAEEVSQSIASGNYGVVAVELCQNRYQTMQKPDAMANMDLLQIIRDGKAAMVSAHLALGAYQQRLAEQYGIEPGAEMRAAIAGAENQGLELALIDRDIGLTLKRTAHRLPWWKRFGLFSGLLFSLVSREEVAEEEVEQLKQGDILENTLAEFAQNRHDLYEPLIAERDQYMAAKLRQITQEHPGKSILAVIGAGHLKGIQQHLTDTQNSSEIIQTLENKPAKSILPRVLPWVITALILIGFYIGFQRSSDLGWQLVINWVLINGGLSALGALLAAAHPLTIITAFVAAPFTSLNPAVGAGMVTATAELMLRKPTVADFSHLRQDITKLSNWWRNRVSRTLLVFLFSTIGSAIGTYLAGFKIIERLSS